MEAENQINTSLKLLCSGKRK